MNFDRGSPLTIVVPTVPTNDPAYPRVVSADDMLALEHVEGLASMAGWSPDRVVSQIDDDVDPSECANIVAICSDKRNKTTELLLSHPDVQAMLGWRFDKISETPERWKLVVDNDTSVESPSYQEEEELRGQSKDPARRPKNDKAILAKLPNPFGGPGKVMIIAGIRGFGTAGAAQFLRTHAKILFDKYGEACFAAVLNVRGSNFRTPMVELSEIDKEIPC